MGVVCVTVLCKIKRLAVPVSFDYLLIPENRQKMSVRNIQHPCPHNIMNSKMVGKI